MIAETLIQAVASPNASAGPQLSSGLLPGTRTGEGIQDLDFADLFRGAVGQVGRLEQQAREAIDGLMRGNGVDVHQAMIAAEKANAAFELTLAVRNKAIQSYQTVMNMQF